MAVVSDVQKIYATVTYVHIAIIRMRASISGIFVPLQAYTYFPGQGVDEKDAILENGLTLLLERDCAFHDAPF